MANFDPSIYPKDLTMSLASNHIVNEVKEFVNREDFIFVPNAGPFYSDSLIIKNTQNGQLLRPIVDYQLLYLNEQASMESNKNVVAVIRVLNTNVPSVMIDYRVIGGEYGNTVAGILQEIRNSGPLNNNVDWEINVFKKPEVFPAAPHYHTADDFTDWSSVWVQLEGIRKAIIAGDAASWASVYRYMDLRLGNVANFLEPYLLKQTFNETVTNLDRNIADLSGAINELLITQDETTKRLNIIADKLEDIYKIVG